MPCLLGQRPLYLFGPILLIATHFVFLACFFSSAVSTPDANSYLTQARTLAHSATTSVAPESPLQYLGPHYAASPNGRYYCAHPPGLSAMLAIPYRLLGPERALFLNPFLCALSLVGLLLLGRRWLGEKLAIVPVALMIVNPFFNEHAHFADAHAAVCFLLIWSMRCLERLANAPSIVIGLAAGFLAGMLPAVRYAEAAYLPALVCFSLSRLREDRSDRKALWAAAAAAAAPIAALGARNQLAYGAFWRTGYAAAEGGALFSAEAFLRNAPSFLAQLPSRGAGFTFPLGVAAIAWMCARRQTRRRGLLLAGIAAPSTILYISYYWPPDPQSMRFLLPTFFLYALASARLLRAAARSVPLNGRVAAAALLILQALWGLPMSLRAMDMLQRQTLPIAQLSDGLADRVPRGSLLIVPGILAQNLDGIGRWRLIDSALVEPRSARLPAPAPMNPDGENESDLVPPTPTPLSTPRLDRYAGLPERQRLAAFSADVWEWAGRARKVYWVTTHAEREALQALLPRGQTLHVVARLDPAGSFPAWRRFTRRTRPEPPNLVELMRESRGEDVPILAEWTR
ncbi:MAG: glycosyltransferase family 39 protein [Elusimicrobia bacterium]|nr:glycosyltransferase family 39 protein [Elusimicrobiota bacterium]